MSEIVVDGCSHPATTIVSDNDSLTVSFAISPEVRVTATLKDKGGIISEGDFSDILHDSAKKTMLYLGHDLNVHLKSNELNTNLPGLNEAHSVATVQAITGLIAKRFGSINDLMMDKTCKRQFVIVDDKIVSLSTLIQCSQGPGLDFGNIVSSFYGGYTIRQDEKILRKGEMEEKTRGFAIINPDFKPRTINTDDAKTHLNEALKSNLYESSVNHAKIVADESMDLLINHLKGRDFFFFTADEGVMTFWTRQDEPDITGLSDFGEVLEIGVSNDYARIDVTARKILKMRKFKRYDGAESFGAI